MKRYKQLIAILLISVIHQKNLEAGSPALVRTMVPKSEEKVTSEVDQLKSADLGNIRSVKKDVYDISSFVNNIDFYIGEFVDHQAELKEIERLGKPSEDLPDAELITKQMNELLKDAEKVSVETIVMQMNVIHKMKNMNNKEQMTNEQFKKLEKLLQESENMARYVQRTLSDERQNRIEKIYDKKKSSWGLIQRMLETSGTLENEMKKMDVRTIQKATKEACQKLEEAKAIVETSEKHTIKKIEDLTQDITRLSEESSEKSSEKLSEESFKKKSSQRQNILMKMAIIISNLFYAIKNRFMSFLNIDTTTESLSNEKKSLLV